MICNHAGCVQFCAECRFGRPGPQLFDGEELCPQARILVRLVKA